MNLEKKKKCAPTAVNQSERNLFYIDYFYSPVNRSAYHSLSFALSCLSFDPLEITVILYKECASWLST